MASRGESPAKGSSGFSVTGEDWKRHLGREWYRKTKDLFQTC